MDEAAALARATAEIERQTESSADYVENLTDDLWILDCTIDLRLVIRAALDATL